MPSRYDFDLNIEDDGVRVKTDRFERLVLTDLAGLRGALGKGFVLELRGTESGHLEVCLWVPARVLLGRFSGLRAAAFQVSDALLGEEGVAQGGPPVSDPSDIEEFLLGGGSASVEFSGGSYQVTLHEKLPPVERRQGAKRLLVHCTNIRRGKSVDFFEAFADALGGVGSIDEVLVLF